MEGWIKLYRKFSDWEWFNVSEMVHLFIYLLLNANHEEGNWRGINIKRGQILTGLNSLNEKTGISIRTLRTCLDRLEKTKEIDRQTTNKYSIITICNYESYQGEKLNSDKHNDKQLTSKRQASDKQATTNNNEENKKNDNNEKKEEELKVRALIFKNLIRDNKQNYSNEILKAFYEYWIEPNKSKTKMRFEAEQFFDILRRLSTWSKRDDRFNKNIISDKTPPVQKITIQDSNTYI